MSINAITTTMLAATAGPLKTPANVGVEETVGGYRKPTHGTNAHFTVKVFQTQKKEEITDVKKRKMFLLLEVCAQRNHPPNDEKVFWCWVIPPL